jgi:glycosyltransferase involved in cell wall biosynthesis
MTLWVHAPNVHQGGGRTLLAALLRALNERSDWRCILDRRLELPDGTSVERIELRVPPNLFRRVGAEWRLSRRARRDDTVFCFGNLPPLFPVAGRIVLFLQNRYLLERLDTRAFRLGTRLRITMERSWLRARAKRVQLVVVQTPSMQSTVHATLGVEPELWPFVESPVGFTRASPERRVVAERPHDFLYVATGEAHKNHRSLLEAWSLLAQRSLFPTLALTLDRTTAPQIVDHVEALKAQTGIRVECLGEIPPREMPALYRSAKAFIFPSLSESLGLPLIEARANGLPILASELDFVRDVVDPEETFDATSPLSIARAVERHLGLAGTDLPVISAREFIARLVGTR